MDITSLARDDIIYTSELARLGANPSELRSLLNRRQLVRIRRGAYVSRARWEAMDERERHVLRVRAVVADHRTPALVSGWSAAALHGFPFRGALPTEVTLLRPHAGGGKSEPGVRQSSAGGMPPNWDVIAGIETTSVARTTLDLMRTLEFADAVACADWALRLGGLAREQLHDELLRTRFRAGRAHIERVLDFAVDVSGSYGESMCRAVIHELGFIAPVLQQEFVDAQGSMFGDFFWPSVKGLAEFDGFVKFSNPEFNAGDPVRALWKEKRREDRLRKQVSGVARLTWDHVLNPRSLAIELERIGIPRGPRNRLMRDVATGAPSPQLELRGRKEAAGRLGA